MHDAVLYQRLEDKIRHFHLQQGFVYFVLTDKLRISAAHQLQICLYQPDFMAYRNHLAVRLYAEPEKIHHLHNHCRHVPVSIQLRLYPYGIQRIVKKMGIDLIF